MGFENGKLVRVVLRATLGDRQEVNTFHYDLDDATGIEPNNPQTLADTFRDDVRGGWAQLYRPRWSIDPVEVVQEVDPQNPLAPRQSWTSGDTIAGTSAGSGDMLPSACTIVTKHTTASIGRRFRGRSFWGGDRGEDEQQDGVWAGPAILDYIATFIGTIPVEPDIAGPDSDATAKWCVYSRTQRAANLDPYASPITGHATRTTVFWQRRRQNI